MPDNSHQQELDRLLQTEWREQIIPNMGNGPWITVYQSPNDEIVRRATIFCGLIPNKFAQEPLASHEWDIHIGDFAPCLMRIANNCLVPSEAAYRYKRYGGQDYEIEPLIIVRYFDEIAVTGNRDIGGVSTLPQPLLR